MWPVILKTWLVLFADGMVTDIWRVRAPPGLAGVDVRMVLRLVIVDFRICFRAELSSNYWVARFECGMSPGRVTFARLPLKGAGSSQSGAVCSLIFRPSTGKKIFGCTLTPAAALGIPRLLPLTFFFFFFSSAPVCIST